jgi:hypothetical protein
MVPLMSLSLLARILPRVSVKPSGGRIRFHDMVMK